MVRGFVDESGFFPKSLDLVLLWGYGGLGYYFLKGCRDECRDVCYYMVGACFL